MTAQACTELWNQSPNVSLARGFDAIFTVTFNRVINIHIKKDKPILLRP